MVFKTRVKNDSIFLYLRRGIQREQISKFDSSEFEKFGEVLQSVNQVPRWSRLILKKKPCGTAPLKSQFMANCFKQTILLQCFERKNLPLNMF
jgi:hypothetical protein